MYIKLNSNVVNIRENTIILFIINKYDPFTCIDRRNKSFEVTFYLGIVGLANSTKQDASVGANGMFSMQLRCPCWSSSMNNGVDFQHGFCAQYLLAMRNCAM